MAQAETNSGGFGPGVPPLPIPNREVKPGRADGTAPQCGRVGRRLLDGALHIILWRAPFFVPAFCVPLLSAFLYRHYPHSFIDVLRIPLLKRFARSRWWYCTATRKSRSLLAFSFLSPFSVLLSPSGLPCSRSSVLNYLCRS